VVRCSKARSLVIGPPRGTSTTAALTVNLENETGGAAPDILDQASARVKLSYGCDDDLPTLRKHPPRAPARRHDGILTRKDSPTQRRSVSPEPEFLTVTPSPQD
jgi:hypothetical protein